MRADSNLGLILLEELDEGTGVKPVECESASFVLPRLVQVIIKPAQHVRRVVDQVEVGSGIESAKDSVGESQSVNVSYVARSAHLSDRLFDGLSRADVTGSS